MNVAPGWLWPGIALAALLACGLLYQALGVARDRRRYPPPGIRRNGIHLHLRGSTGPWVVLEAGIAASSASWRPVADLLASGYRVLAYDRPGFGWSDARRAPRDIPVLVEELREALDLAGVGEPVLFIGHSFGGLLGRHFCARYPARVAGLVLADPLLPEEWHPASPEQLHRLGRGVMLSRRGAVLARLGVVRLALELLTGGSTRIPKLLARASSSAKGAAITNRLVGEVRKLPADLWPVIGSHWCLPRSFATMAAYLDRLSANCALAPDDEALAGKPLVVISAATAEARVQEGHAALAARSTLGRHLVAEDSGHWIQLDRPDVIAASLKEVTMGMNPRKESA
ncbi:MAG: alpha/beta hydrolase [Solibacteraceae bacterium]|nr:alpha/beta hydrolase [Solibacteraceae bacterium]